MSTQNRVRQIRRRLDFEQKDFAPLIQISPSYLSHLERGVRKIPADIAEKLDLLQGALERDTDLGARIVEACGDKHGFRRVVAAWSAVLEGVQS